MPSWEVVVCKAAESPPSSSYYCTCTHILIDPVCVCVCVCVGVGPDICGPGTKKVHVILSHKGENKLTKKDIRCKVSNSATYAYNFIQSQNFSLLPLLPVPLVFLPSLLSSPLSPTQDDEFTHLYTLILRPDNTYEVKIDNKRVEGGPIQDNWDMLLPTEILDPEATKPEDWDDRAKIPDPEDTKSEVRKRDDLILHCQCLCRWLCPSLCVHVLVEQGILGILNAGMYSEWHTAN